MEATITFELVGLIVALGIALAMWTKTVIKAELADQLKDTKAQVNQMSTDLAVLSEKQSGFERRLNRAGINGGGKAAPPPVARYSDGSRDPPPPK